MFFCPDDLKVLENFAYGDTPTESAVAGLVEEVFSQGDDFDLSNYEISAKHDIRNTVARTLLTYLELLGHIEAGTHRSMQISVQTTLISSNWRYGHFDGQRKAFLQKLLAQAKKAQTWFHINLEQSCQNIGEPRDRVVRANMTGLRWLELPEDCQRAPGLISLRRQPKEQGGGSSRRFTPCCGESREIERACGRLPVGSSTMNVGGAATGRHLAIRWISPAAIVRGAKPAASRSRNLPPTTSRSIDPATWSQARKAYESNIRAQSVAVLYAFLCGVSSPGWSKQKLQRRLFGAGDISCPFR